MMYARQDCVQLAGRQLRNNVFVLACLESLLQCVLIRSNQCGQLCWQSLPKPSVENLKGNRFDGYQSLIRLCCCRKLSTATIDLAYKFGALLEPDDVLVIFAGISRQEVDIVIVQLSERHITAIRSLTF